jgi:ribosomal protein L29
MDLKNKSDNELGKALIDKRKTLHSFRFGIAGSKVRNVREGRNTRHEIARILTEINFRKKTKI